jgi:hypothetical protein
MTEAFVAFARVAAVDPLSKKKNETSRGMSKGARWRGWVETQRMRMRTLVGRPGGGGNFIFLALSRPAFTSFTAFV